MLISTENEAQKSNLESLLAGVVDNLENFIEAINCIKETYEYSEVTLRAHHSEAIERYNVFVDSCEKSEEDGNKVLVIPIERVREFLFLGKKKDRAKRALELVPPSYFVSLVSAYDSFFAGLIKDYYRLCPEKFLESEMSFLYRDLQAVESISDIKKRIVNKNVDSLLRDSHVAQLDWLAKAIDVSTLRSFDGWKDFVELTERRNLFVHSNGAVSNQYISVCKANCALAEGIIEGNQLEITKDYFDKAYKTLYKVSVLLTQVLLRVKYVEKGGDGVITDVDKVLIKTVYELIEEEMYDVAIAISEDILSNHKYRHNGYDRAYIILNCAQAYKWSGNNEKCLEILKKEDWSAFTNELLIPRYTLEENYVEVYRRMKELGPNNSRINISAYREWPIFKKLREQKEFETVFAEIFGEAFDGVKRIDISGPKSMSGTSSSTLVG